MGFLSNLANGAEGAAFVEKIKSAVDELVSSGKLQEARAYVEKALPTVKEKYPQLVSAVEKIAALIPKN